MRNRTLYEYYSNRIIFEVRLLIAVQHPEMNDEEVYVHYFCINKYSQCCGHIVLQKQEMRSVLKNLVK